MTFSVISEVLFQLKGRKVSAAITKANSYMKDCKDSNKKKDFVQQLLASPSFDNLLNVLRDTKFEFGRLGAFYECMSYILLNLTDDVPAHKEIAVKITDNILKKHEDRLQEMLSDRRPIRVKLALSCLKGMAAFGEEPANMLLHYLDSKAMHFERFLEFRNYSDDRDVRSYYVQLILAFLMSDDPSTVDHLLSKTGLLQSILPGLQHDTSQQVLKVLRVLHESLLMNPGVSKAVKVYLFTPETTRHLMNVYEWEIPEGVTALKKKAHIEKSNEESEVVRKEVEEFMVTLLTSDKYGIWFKMKATENNVYALNPSVYSIICSVKKPWRRARNGWLMAHIFAACPVLMGSYFESLNDLVFPRSSMAFVVLMEMVVVIMKNQKPWLWIQSGDWRTVFSCLFPGSPLIPEFYLKLSQSSHRGTRHVGCLLMLTILKKVEQTMENMKDLELSDENKERIHQVLRRKISTTFTKQILESVINSVEDILINISKQDVGHTSEEGSQAEESDDIDIPPSREILAIVDFLCTYNELTSSGIEETLSPVKVFRILKALTYLEVSEQTSNASTVMKDFWKPCHYLLAKSVGNRKFNVNTSNLEENIFYILITTFAQYHNSNKYSLQVSEGDMLTSFANVVLYTLGKAGLVDDSESIKHWLWYISGPESVKLCAFLTHVIQQTVNSYNQYTDQLIELREKYGNCSEFVFGNSDLNFCSDKTSLARVCNKAFSRFVLAAVDLLSGNPDAECTNYFSCVLIDYLHTLHDPGLLISFLLEKESVIDESLRAYLGCFFKHPEHSGKKESDEYGSDINLSTMLKKSFMTQDWSSLDSLLKAASSLRELVKSDLCTVVLQLLMYIMIEFKKNNSSGIPVVRKYTKLLEKLYASLKVDNKESAALLAKTVLEDPRMLIVFSPLHYSKCPVSSLCQHLIESVLKEHCGFESCTSPYYQKVLTTLKSTSLQPELSPDIWSVVLPFINSEITVISYDDLEELLLICLKTPCSMSQHHSSFIHSLLNLLLKTTTAQRQPKEETVHMIFKMYLEWNTTEEGDGLESFRDVLAIAEEFLLLTLTEEVAKEISKKDVKKLLLKCPSSSNICCHLAELYRPHGAYMAAKLKDFNGELTTKAQLVTVLLRQEESKNAAQEALEKLLGILKEWAMNLTDDDQVYHDLLLHSLNADMMGTDDVVDICTHWYEKVINDNVVPGKDITLISVLYEKVSNNEMLKLKLQLGDGNLSLLHILLSIIKSLCKRVTTNIAALLNCCRGLEEILPGIHSKTLQNSFSDTKLWPSFIKEVLRISLGNQEIGPHALRSLELMIKSLYKSKREIATFEKESGISLSTVFQMVISHTKYVSLMFQREAEWDRLKESVVALQQTIVDNEGRVCLEEHVPLLLGAYGASMSAADQRILKLLHAYEVKGAMKRYQPVLWGDAAVMHFGKSSNDKFRELKVSQILALLESSKILKSCRLFDMTLPLEPHDVCGDDRSVYDLRFMIPLMLYLGENEEILEIDLAESGAVAVGFTCLSSYQKEVWGAGAAILKCVIDKMTKSRHHRFKLPWVWAMTKVSSSFNGTPHRIPSLLVHFLLRVTSLLSNPQDPMYFPILRGFFVRPVLKLRVPQLGRLYASADFNYSQFHLLFLLNVLASGIRQPEDYLICEKDSVSMLMVSLLRSPMADTEIRVQVLQVLESMVHLPVAAKDLVIKQNLLTMLPAAISTSYCGPDRTRDVAYSEKSSLIAAVVKVLDALWPSMFIALEKKTPLFERLEFMETNKRKRDNKGSGVDGIAKKFKTADGVGKRADVTDSQPEKQHLRPIFLEEYLHCLLHLTSTVIEDASPGSVTKHLNLLVNAVKYVVEISKGIDKETLRNVALDPLVVKKRVYDCIPWESFSKCLRNVLTDVEEVRLLGPKAEKNLDEWRKARISALPKKGEHKPVSWEVDSTELKTVVFDLLHLVDS